MILARANNITAHYAAIHLLLAPANNWMDPRSIQETYYQCPVTTLGFCLMNKSPFLFLLSPSYRLFLFIPSLCFFHLNPARKPECKVSFTVVTGSI